MENESEKAVLDHKKFARIVKESGKTQEEFSEDIGISAHYLRKLKSENKDISVSLASNISKQSGRTIESILTSQTPQIITTSFYQQLQKEYAKALTLSHAAKNYQKNIRSLLAALGQKGENKNAPNDTVESICQELSELTSLLLNYVRQSAAADVRPYSLNKLILDTIQNRLNYFTAHNIEVELILDNNLPDVILSKQHIKQVLFNCLNNSLDAISAGKLPCGKIFIWTHFDKGKKNLQVIIADNGNGTAKEQQNYFLAPCCAAKLKDGDISAGINLAVIKQHGGQMSVSSLPKTGCCVRIELPLHSAKPFDEDNLYQKIVDMLF